LYVCHEDSVTRCGKNFAFIRNARERNVTYKTKVWRTRGSEILVCHRIPPPPPPRALSASNVTAVLYRIDV
jgi:hypothetical protein